MIWRYLFSVAQYLQIHKILAFKPENFAQWRTLCIITLFYASGIRVSELTHLHTENVNTKEGWVLAFGKGRKQRFIPIHEHACKVVEDYLSQRQAHFAGKDTDSELFLNKNGKKIEILVNYNPKLHYVNEWWKQLYGESEGKEGKGIFPAAVDFSTDLHSMGQWIQEGERTIYETVISIEHPTHKLEVPSDEENLDGLNFLAGKRVDEVNKMAELGTQLAHVDGGVPNMRISVPTLNEESIGGLLYFFEKACGISGYLLGVNTFNQPGVEAYKKNMFALLNKPGYEEQSKAIRARL